MTRKDFEAIAKILRYKCLKPDVCDDATLREVAICLADYLSTTNPRFDRGRFMTASGF